MIKNIKSKSRKSGDKIAFCVYAFDIGDNLIKVGYTNDTDRREGEHRRKYGQATLLGAVQVSTYIHGDKASFIKAKANAELIENQILTTLNSKLVNYKDNQNGDTERYYMNSEVTEIDVKVRKTYKLRVG